MHRISKAHAPRSIVSQLNILKKNQVIDVFDMAGIYSQSKNKNVWMFKKRIAGRSNQLDFVKSKLERVNLSSCREIEFRPE